VTAPARPQAPQGWRGVRSEVLRRIRARVWAPGDPIPNEADLAAELGVARTTVNRALRELATAGILERRRRSGTRVARHPVGRAVVEIPVLRQEIEAQGLPYAYRLLRAVRTPPPPSIVAHLSDDPALHLVALHSAGRVPYVVEDRWINLTTVPEAETQDFGAISANEWLLGRVPFTRGEIAISALPCMMLAAQALKIPAGREVLALDRTTFDDRRPVTFVRLWFRPGHRIESALML